MTFILVLGFLLISCSSIEATYIKRVENVSIKFLDYIVAGDFDKASEYVYYFNYYTDTRLEGYSKEEAMEIWKTRVRELQKVGIYLESYHDLKIRIDDGYPKGRVTLTIVNGKEKVSCDASVYLILQNGWEVAGLNFSEEDGSTLEQLSKAFSGRLNQ